MMKNTILVQLPLWLLLGLTPSAYANGNTALPGASRASLERQLAKEQVCVVPVKKRHKVVHKKKHKKVAHRKKAVVHRTIKFAKVKHVYTPPRALETSLTKRADAYFDGRGVPQDLTLALNLYRTAGDAGNPYAAYRVSIAYQYGYGVIADAGEANLWYDRAHRHPQHVDAEMIVAQHYEDYACALYDRTQAVIWWTRAAEAGAKVAANALGDLYTAGEGGIYKNIPLAFKWYGKAAALNYPPAQYSIGVLFYDGDGIADNPVEATRWWRKAAEQGYMPAQNALAEVYAKGDTGIAARRPEAYAWWSLLSGQARYPEVKAKMDDLLAGFTPAENARAVNLAHQYRLQYGKQLTWG